MAESAVDFNGSGGGETTTFTAGSVFGISENEANYPLAMTTPQPVTGYRQAYEPAPPPQRKYGTVLQGVSQFYHLSAEDQAIWTEKMVEGGYLEPESMHKPQSVYSAWRNVVRDAARSGVTVYEILNGAIDAYAKLGGPGGSGGGSPTIAQLSDPASVNQTLDEAMTAILGQKATKKQKDAFLAGIQHAEKMNAQKVHDAAESNGSTDIVGVDVGSRAQEFARNADPLKADARKVVAAAEVLSNMLRGNV